MTPPGAADPDGRTSGGPLLRLLPPGERETVAGDLLEEGLRPGSAAWTRAVLAVALHFHVEAWRDEGARLAALLSLTAGFALWWAVWSRSGMPGGEVLDLYRDPLSRAAIRFWGASHLPAALAAGLLVGHAPWVPSVGRPTRWHVAAVLAGVAAWATPGAAGAASAGLLLSAAWLGDAARQEPPGPPAARTGS